MGLDNKIGEGLTIAGYFSWKEYSNMKNIQLFYFYDSNAENIISIYYDSAKLQMVVEFDTINDKRNIFKFNLNIKYSIYYHYMFIFDLEGNVFFCKNFLEIQPSSKTINDAD